MAENGSCCCCCYCEHILSSSLLWHQCRLLCFYRRTLPQSPPFWCFFFERQANTDSTLTRIQWLCCAQCVTWAGCKCFKGNPVPLQRWLVVILEKQKLLVAGSLELTCIGRQTENAITIAGGLIPVQVHWPWVSLSILMVIYWQSQASAAAAAVAVVLHVNSSVWKVASFSAEDTNIKLRASFLVCLKRKYVSQASHWPDVQPLSFILFYYNCSVCQEHQFSIDWCCQLVVNLPPIVHINTFVYLAFTSSSDTCQGKFVLVAVYKT